MNRNHTRLAAGATTAGLRFARLAAIVATASTLALAGCGQSSSPTPSTTGAATTTSAATAASTQPATSDKAEQANWVVTSIKTTRNYGDEDRTGPDYAITRNADGSPAALEISAWDTTPAERYTFGDATSYTLEGEDAQAGTATATVDSAGHVTSLAYPGHTETFTYDDAGRLVARESDSVDVPFTKTYEYDADGRLATYASTTNGYTTTTAYSYDDQGRMVSGAVSYTAADGSTQEGPTAIYGYEAPGRLASVTYEGASAAAMLPVTYTYDETGHLVSAKAESEGEGTYEATFEYDDNGCVVRTQDTFTPTGGGAASVTTREITYEQAPEGYPETPSDKPLAMELSLNAQFGPVNRMDAIELARIYQTQPGIPDPTPFKTDSIVR